MRKIKYLNVKIKLNFSLKDIVKFIAIFLIVFISFLFSINNLYLYYNTEIRKKVEITVPYNANSKENPFLTNAEEAFGT
jgi:hypothetical protein